VVVTALGIKREEKGLGYATETVKGDKITSALPSNWSTALNGIERSQRDGSVRYACSQRRDYGDYEIGSRRTQRYRRIL